ncbi:MFS monocarboxylic acid transporter [Trichophyton interdigitale]|nr:MFS monocarboxylic acid transporter [Trichophyton interdigitale]KAG5217720.1 MFS monocarboxylic acid transporter [Trichophyton interdigitale]KAG8207348.1 MFS monocarboxylic acid transporter [Trichophyton interdigitale]
MDRRRDAAAENMTMDDSKMADRRPDNASDSDSESESDDGSMAGGPDMPLVRTQTMDTERDRENARKEVVRLVAFVSSVLNALSAGGIAAFSLYGPLLLTRLHYTQFRVNVIAVTAEMLTYLSAPLFGFLCDRVRPSLVSFISAVLFGAGYLLAAFTYRSGPPASLLVGLPEGDGGPARPHGWPFSVMVIAYAIIGAATACMYFSAVTTSAKNYASSKHKGIMLAAPIAAYGLSGIWYSFLVKFFVYRGADSTAHSDGSGVDLIHGDVDVFRFFVFLAIVTFTVGVIGGFALNVVDEEKLIEDGVEELERSGLLVDTDGHYGTFRAGHAHDDTSNDAQDNTHPDDKLKKTWLLNQETKLFLHDRTMWLLSIGFILISGPGEAYMNNVGTLTSTLSPPSAQDKPGTPLPAGEPSTHVALMALTSTLARLITGSLSDYFAPRPASTSFNRRTFSRLFFLIPCALLVSLGYLVLSSPIPLSFPSFLHLTTTFIGFGYGACFSLVPIIISVVWGVENFGTNWAIVSMIQAPGAGLSGAIYSAEYDSNVSDNGQCFGWKCYGFWAVGSVIGVLIAASMWMVAWRGWKRRSIPV